MATNYDKSGNSWEGPAPEDVISGQAIMLGSQLAVAQSDALEGELCAFALSGVYVLPSMGASHDVGEPLNRDVNTGALYGGDAVAGDWAGVAMSFSPGGGAIALVEASINTHLGTFAVAAEITE